MNVYLQRPDGTELELQVRTPDPDDGTFTVFLPDGHEDVVLTNDDWIRIDPTN